MDKFEWALKERTSRKVDGKIIVKHVEIESGKFQAGSLTAAKAKATKIAKEIDVDMKVGLWGGSWVQMKLKSWAKLDFEMPFVDVLGKVMIIKLVS